MPFFAKTGAALALCALAALSAPAAHAQTTLNFDNFTAATGGTDYSVGASYSTQGFTLTSPTDYLFAIAGSNSTYGDGETSLYSNNGAGTTLAQTNGNPFTLTAIDLGHLPFAATATGNIYEPFLFTGTQVGGGTVMATVNVAPATGYETFTFSGFTNLTLLTFGPISNAGNSLQFDNVVLSPGNVVPESSGLANMAAALLALGLGALVMGFKKKARA